MEASIKIVPPLPSTAGEHLAHRKLKAKRTLNDHVEDEHLKLIENEDYRALLDAVYDEQAVEGSTEADTLMAAKMIREKAVKTNNTEVTRQKLATIAKALNVVLSRYGFGRKQRRNTVGGEVVNDDE